MHQESNRIFKKKQKICDVFSNPLLRINLPSILLMSEGLMGAASILTHTSSSLIGTGGSSTTLQTASGGPCCSYTTAFEGGDVADENARKAGLAR